MSNLEIETAISSLTQMRSYYQLRYEHYLAQATLAKENFERVELLLQDLSSQPHSEGKMPTWEDKVEDSSTRAVVVEEKSPSARLLEQNESPQKIGSELIVFNGSERAISATENDSAEERETFSVAEQTRKLLKNLSKAMSVIESVSNSDSGKTLHSNYLEKMLSKELSHPINPELVRLYLDEAIERGYIERDRFDSDCYVAKSGVRFPSPRSEKIVSPQKNSAMTKMPKSNQGQDSPPFRQSYNLPSSNKLKPTLLETIKEYITRESPKRFSIEDVINYLYSEQQQQDWSRQRKTLVRSCVSNALSRKAYLNKHWKRVKPGIYRPL